MKLKHIVVTIILVMMLINYLPMISFANENKENIDVFYDDFSGNKLDSNKWLVAHKAWGGKNGGVVPENVSIKDGKLVLEGHGDKYKGDVEGVKRPDGTRTGAAIATKEYFGSGSYEVLAKVAPELGACSAIWTFEYEEYYPGDEKYEELGGKGQYIVVNHEIDIEMPGRPTPSVKDMSYEYALCNTWIGEKGNEYTASHTKLPTVQNDGKFHKYRFDWHTGDVNEEPRVEFYFDDELVVTNYTHIPTNEGRLWIGLWFPNGWAGNPDFDTTAFEIDYVKITPFHELGDTKQSETYGNDGWNNEAKILEDPMTAQEIIDKMKVGINLGNTLDSCDYKKQFLGTEKGVSYYETLWGNPQITEELIKNIKSAGFESIRLPVTYYDHVDEKGNIDKLWLDRVEEVVNYILNNDLYCILDVHHDSGLCDIGSWIKTDADKYEENAEKLSKLWIQIANRFKNYDHRLIFEGFNEIVDTNKNYNWESGYKNTVNVMKLNQVFVDTVRNTGGKNKDRFLAVSTFGAITDEQKLSTFKMPNDTADNKIILALHDYTNDSDGLNKMFARIKKYCIDKNIPVILDEFGTIKNSMSLEERVKSLEEYVSMAKKLGITCFIWDDGGDYMIYNRNNNNWEFEQIKNAIINASNKEKEINLVLETALKANSTTVKKGELLKITPVISKIECDESYGLYSIMGRLEYDKDVLEIDLSSIKGLNSWNINEEYFNNDNFKFVLDTSIPKKEIGDIFEVTFKVKENIENKDTVIRLADVEAGTGDDNGLVKSNNYELKIELLDKEKEILIGDIDANGILTVNDLVLLKLHLIEKVLILGDNRINIADMDRDGKITINDLALLKIKLSE